MEDKRYKASLKKIMNKKYILPIACITLIAIIAGFSLYSTFALVVSQTEVIENKFKLQKTEIEIVEEFKTGDSVKKNVKVLNTGEATMYVRVALVEQLITKEGLIIPNTTETSYFTYENLCGKDWLAGKDGYFYYKLPLKASEPTSMLFTKATPSYQVKESEKLSLTVMVEAIQVKGIEKWPVTLVNGNITGGNGR